MPPPYMNVIFKGLSAVAVLYMEKKNNSNKVFFSLCDFPFIDVKDVYVITMYVGEVIHTIFGYHLIDCS